jgi:hypothetical protein
MPSWVSFLLPHKRLLIAIAPLVLVAAACGSSPSLKNGSTTTTAATGASKGTGGSSAVSSGPVPTGDAAVAGGVEVTKAQVNALISEFRAADKGEHMRFPSPGTPGYKHFQDDAVNYFVQAAVFEQRAKQELGITITDADVAKSIASIRDNSFGGSQAKMLKHYASVGVDLKQLEIFQRLQLAENELPPLLAAHAGVRKSISDKEAYNYYQLHRVSFQNEPYKQVKPKVIQDLVQHATHILVRQWVAKIVHTSCSEIRYQDGYRPDNLVCSST